MRTHTNDFKNNIKKMGRQLECKITYDNTTLTGTSINSINFNYKSDILKSVMKQLEIDTTTNIPLNTILNYQIGLKVGNQYEYIDMGNFIVNKVEKCEDTNSYKITCLDKMLYFMKDYQNIGVQYPITIRNYMNALCSAMGLTFANANDTFTNYDKEIPYELYLDVNGNDIGYTFRDVLNELAQVTASTIVINSDDEVEIKYIPSSSVDTLNKQFCKDINVKFGEKYGPINSIVLSRSAESDNITKQNEESITANGLCEIKISENQIMNFSDRDEYLDGIYDRLNGLTYYINDYKSPGIVYLDVCDKYNIEIDDTTYSCVMFNDEIIQTQGLEENIYTEMPEETETDYTKTDRTDRRINQAMSMVDKQNLVITSLVSETQQTQELNESRILELTERTNAVEQTITSTQATIEVIQQEMIDGQQTLTNNLVTIDINGINVSTNSSAIETLLTNEKFVIKSGEKILAFFGYDSDDNITKAEMDNLTITNYLTTGNHRIEKCGDYKERTGFFYIGG